MYFVAIFFIEM